MQTVLSPKSGWFGRIQSNVIATLLAGIAVGTLAADFGARMAGFLSPETIARQEALEKKFDALLDPSDQRAWLEQMSAEPNHVGAPHNKANAEFMLAKFREWGWDAHIETFDVLYPTPKEVSLELIAPHKFAARLNEPAVAGDRTSAITKLALPPYNVFGADGDVTAELIYVNRGCRTTTRNWPGTGSTLKA